MLVLDDAPGGGCQNMATTPGNINIDLNFIRDSSLFSSPGIYRFGKTRLRAN